MGIGPARLAKPQSPWSRTNVQLSMDEEQEFNHLAEMKMNPHAPSTTQLLQMEVFLSSLLSFRGSDPMNNGRGNFNIKSLNVHV